MLRAPPGFDISPGFFLAANQSSKNQTTTPQCVTAPKILIDTGTYTAPVPIKNIQISKILRQKSVPVSNFSDTGSQTFFWYPIFLIPVPRPFHGTKYFGYRFQDFFPVPNFSDTGSETFFRYQFVPIPVPIPTKK